MARYHCALVNLLGTNELVMYAELRSKAWTECLSALYVKFSDSKQMFINSKGSHDAARR
jgi:hypothetical protein